jgi:predicted dehydrogenase
MTTKILLVEPNQFHIDCLRNIPDVQLTALIEGNRTVVDGDNQLTEQRLIFSDFREVLKDEISEGVIVCNTSEYCNEVLVQSARAGKSILCETPNYSHVQARKIWTICQAYDVLLGVSFPHRLSLDQKVLRQQIKKGELGRFQIINLIKRNNRNLNGSRITPASNVFRNIGIKINLIDTLRWLFNSEFTSVRSPTMATTGRMVETEVGKWVLKMSNSYQVHCDFDPFIPSEEEKFYEMLEIEIIKREGKPVLRRPLKTIFLENARKDESLNSSKDLISQVIKNFVRAIQGRQPIAATGLDMLRAHEVLEAISLAKHSKNEVFI